MVTIFKNIFAKEPHYRKVDKALERIRSGSSKGSIEEIRGQLSKDRADKLKENLPSVCFSGKFSKRLDECLIEHSGFIVLDFDEVPEIREKQTEIINHDFVYACWLSPRGNGIKALVKIADGLKHRQHFQALQEIFPDVDKSGVNESRVCYESYDPEIYINQNAKAFTKIKSVETIVQTEILTDTKNIFDKILKWLTNKGDAFVTGERNVFVFKLASACCRFGITEQDCLSLITENVIETSDSFSLSECTRTVKSAFKANKNKSGSASFQKDILVDTVNRQEVKIDPDVFDVAIKAKDVIFGEDVKKEALRIYDYGYERIDGIGVDAIDYHFKFKRGEISLLTGIGNYGKTTFWHWLLLMRVLKHSDKFALFSPEYNPPSRFYHDFVEALLGCDTTPGNSKRPPRNIYEAAYDYISKRIFFVYPKTISPSPDYIKEIFLELIIKEKVTGVVIDPFNQLANDYSVAGGRSDKYLETFLSDCSRFAQNNGVFFSLIAHPKILKKGADGNYPEPDVYDIADGAMWNNKMDNILVYHRPNHQKEPNSPMCEMHTKKIRDQKSVGRKGIVEFELARPSRRYFFSGEDPMEKLIQEKKLDFHFKQKEIIWDPETETELEEAPF